MKKILIVAAAALNAAGVWAADGGKAPVKIDGKAVYGARCASCHAKDSKGNPAMVKMFKVDASAMDLTGKDAQGKSATDLSALISAGKGKMPSYKDKLSADEIGAVAAYIKTLAPKEAKN
jgi:cytochrome c6